ncbi:MAG TPA: hypothetical protein VKA66_17080, partial [Mycobacterium sp.]|nr:hypothetical protein [Mycobacterium sp.]
MRDPLTGARCLFQPERQDGRCGVNDIAEYPLADNGSIAGQGERSVRWLCVGGGEGVTQVIALTGEELHRYR